MRRTSAPSVRNSSPSASTASSGLRFRFHAEMSSRECGSCDVCCSRYRVDELGLKMGQGCELLNKASGGCSIHSQPFKPPVCTDYRCLWLLGHYADDQRPDQVPTEALTVMLTQKELDFFVRSRVFGMRHTTPEQVLEVVLAWLG